MKVIWLFFAAMLVATDAAAQSIVLTAGYYRENKRFSGDPEMNVLDTDANGLQLAVGTLVIPRCIVELEVGVSGGSSLERSTIVSYLGQNVDIRTQYSSKLTTWSALVGLRGAAAGRFQLTYLGGVTFFHVTRRITPNSQTVIVQPVPPPTTSTTVDNIAGPTIGVDAAIRATQHFAVVFLVRAQALRISSDLAGFTVRPGVAAQFSF
jgi:hypothetical protein